MDINIELTKKFYDNFSSCKCNEYQTYCRYIQKEQPGVFDYLISLGINPKKPYDLISLIDYEENRIIHLECIYLVYGEELELFNHEIDGIKVFSCSKEKYYFNNLEDNCFLICIGPIKMSYNCGFPFRHLNNKAKVNLIKKAIDEIDPIGLLKIGAPKDEYLQEAILLSSLIRVKKVNKVSKELIQDIFKKQFNESLDIKLCKLLANRISKYLNMKDLFINFSDIKCLKDKASIEDSIITIKIHDDFVVTTLNNDTYINGKFYYDIDEQDLLDSYLEFINNDTYYYVQYKKPYLSIKNSIVSYIKEFKKETTSLYKLKKIKNIDKIFDNKDLIYDSQNKNSYIEYLISKKFNEPKKSEFVKLFLSLESYQRFYILKDKSGGYFYKFEKLCIYSIDDLPLSEYAYWQEMDEENSTSYFESVQLIMNEVGFKINGWIEKQ